MVTDYNGEWNKVLVWRNLDQIRGIAVSPSTGYMFWSCWGDNPHIGRAGMDGTDPVLLMQKEEGMVIEQPTALVIDHFANRLYWVDAVGKSLHVMTFSGHDRILREGDEQLRFALQMDLFEDR
eukprot:sb/3475879/